MYARLLSLWIIYLSQQDVPKTLHLVHLDEILGLQTPVDTRSCLGQALINQRLLVRALLVS